jgi:hypothetical protein
MAEIIRKLFIPDDQRLGPIAGTISLLTNGLERSSIRAARWEQNVGDLCALCARIKLFGQPIDFQSVSNGWQI